MRITKPYLSIVVPVYNGSVSLKELHKRLTASLQKLGKTYELIFVDDGSPDDSWKRLVSLFQKDTHVRIFRLGRNFGQHNALMCGFTKALGEVIVTIDDDLQNPPEEIGNLLLKLEEGYDLVYGEYTRKRHSMIRNLGSTLVQNVYKRVFRTSNNLTTFRAIRAYVVKAILNYRHNFTFIDGLLAWQTGNIGYVIVRHHNRYYGKSSYSITKLFVLSANMLTNFSIVPLQIASFLGISLSLLGLVMALYYLLKKLIYDIPVTGFATIIIAILIFSGVQLLTIGLIGEYIGRIHLNINRKPQYVLKEARERNNAYRS